MIRTSHTLTNNKIYSLPISIDERYKYSLTSVSKKQIMVRSTFEKDKTNLGRVQGSKKQNQTKNK